MAIKEIIRNINPKYKRVEIMSLIKFWVSILFLKEAILFGALILYPQPTITEITITTVKYRFTKPKLSTWIFWNRIGVIIKVKRILISWLIDKLKKFLKKIFIIFFFISI